MPQYRKIGYSTNDWATLRHTYAVKKGNLRKCLNLIRIPHSANCTMKLAAQRISTSGGNFVAKRGCYHFYTLFSRYQMIILVSPLGLFTLKTQMRAGKKVRKVLMQ